MPRAINDDIKNFFENLALFRTYLCFVMLLAHNLWIYTKSQSQTPENTASTAGWNDFVVGVRTRAMKCDQFMTYRNDSDYVQSYRILAVVGLQQFTIPTYNFQYAEAEVLSIVSIYKYVPIIIPYEYIPIFILLCISISIDRYSIDYGYLVTNWGIKNC